jgi:hypothetical protein
MAQQHRPLSYEERVKAFDKLRRLVDQRPDGPTRVEARRVGNAMVNREIDDAATRGSAFVVD